MKTNILHALAALVAASGLFGGIVLAQNANQVVPTLLGTELIQLQPSGFTTAASLRDSRGWVYQVPLTGFTLTMTDLQSVVSLNPAGTIAAGTIVLPPTLIDGKTVSIFSSQTITALTLSTSNGASSPAPTTLAANTQVEFVYDKANNAWHLLKGGPPFINLKNYTQTFASNFSAGLVATAQGPSVSGQWIYNKPGGGNFGNVGFGDVFSTSSAGLAIRLYKDNNSVWHAGLLASVDASGNGFSQQWGYFEMSAQLPAALGSNWPAFWLLDQVHVANPAAPPPAIEIDVVEQFGNFFPHLDKFAYHEYFASSQIQQAFSQDVGSMSNGYNSYGVDIEPDFTTWYYNRAAIGSIPTPAVFATPMFMLVDLALSGDPNNPDPLTTNPSFMNVAYINVYSHN